MCSFKKGDILLESKPFATILTKENVDKRCEVCFCEFEFLGKEKREQNGLLRRQCSQEIIQCSDCSNYLYYCSIECLKEDIPIHRYECGLFSDEFPQFDATRMMIRLYIKLKYGNGWNEHAILHNGKTRGFKDLLSHSKDLLADEKTHKDLLYFYDLVYSYINQIERRKKEENVFTFEMFIEIYGKLVVNGFEITDDVTKDTIGWGIYLLPSIIDHSCQPNAMVSFQGGKNITVLSIDDILTTNKHLDFAKDVSISYIDCLEPTEERKRLLKEQYFFDCLCCKCEKSVPCKNKLKITNEEDEVDSLRNLLRCTEL